jgi:hypothetical protein
VKKFTCSLILLIILCISCIITVCAVDDTAIITTTGHRVSYTVDYGRYVKDVKLNYYQLQTDVSLDPVNTWEIYASNNGDNWSVIDTQTNISFVANTPQLFTIGSPVNNQYYKFKINNGFYDVGKHITILFNTTSTATTPNLTHATGAHVVVDNEFDIYMTNTRVLYTIDYGNVSSNVTLLHYHAFANVSLINVQSWDIYGSNDHTGWSLVDSQANKGVSTDQSHVYSVSNAKPYQFYMIYLNNGYYNIGKTAVFIFNTDHNGSGTIIPTPTVTPTPIIYPTQNEGTQSSEVRAEIGETYIKWMWTYNSLPADTRVNIYTNDTNKPEQMNYIGNSYLVTNLSAGEKHTIAIYTANGSQLIGRAAATTNEPSDIIYLLFGLCIVITIVAAVLPIPWLSIILSIANIIFAIIWAGEASGHGLLPYLFFACAILTGLILLIKHLPKLWEEISWL